MIYRIVLCVQCFVFKDLSSLTFHLLLILSSEHILSLISMWVCEAVRIYCRKGCSKTSVQKKETVEIDFISHEVTTSLKLLSLYNNYPSPFL
jgi:hypothetical protein